MLLQSIPMLTSVTTFVLYGVLDHAFTAAKVFITLFLLSVPRLPLFQLPKII